MVEFAFACINNTVEIILREGGKVARGLLFSIDPKTLALALKKVQIGEDRFDIKLIQFKDIQYMKCSVPEQEPPQPN